MRHDIIQEQAYRQGEPVEQCTAHQRDHKAELTHQMGGNGQENLALAKVFPYQFETEFGQVAEAPVDKAGGTGRRPAGEVLLLHKQRAQTAESCVPCDTRSDYASSDHN